MELFKELQENNIWDAQIVGKNLFCKNPADIYVFTEYFDFCIKVANYPVDIETRSLFVNEADLCLTIFTEKVKIDKESLEIIQEKRSVLVSISSEINNIIAKNDKDALEERKSINNDALTTLSRLKGRIASSTSQVEFDRILSEMSICENKLDKEILTDTQISLYNNLTREFSTLVSKKMADFAYLGDIKYNKDAAISFKKAFDLFKADESKYKESDNHLYELVAKYLFAYDAKRLFNETLVYYNHVYTFIFNKLDDDGKYRFTQFSFDTPKTK